jgi:hypothetical protein
MSRAEQVVCLDKQVPMLAEMLDNCIEARSVSQPGGCHLAAAGQLIGRLRRFVYVVQKDTELIARYP